MSNRLAVLPKGSLPVSEQEITDILVSCLRKTFGVTVRSKCEVSADGRARADIAVMVADKVLTIEVKRSDWKRAIGQAVLNRYCADHSYIALWESRINQHVLSEAEAWGIGVLAVDYQSVRIAKAAPAARPDNFLRDCLVREVEAS